ncbi:hypothetical protein V5O48_015525 [Marasmius crinis-equi]|uniref:Uncharacterized protein n=1 Tax=Marasmius crinis-equi TaxID=585013 RepID=A0ABR3EUA1_9AGAR
MPYLSAARPSEKIVDDTEQNMPPPSSHAEGSSDRPFKANVAVTRILESFQPTDVPRTNLPDIADCYDADDNDQALNNEIDQILERFPWEEVERGRLELQRSEEELRAEDLAEAAKQWHLGPDNVDSDDEEQECEIEPQIHLAEDPDQSDDEMEASGRKQMRTSAPEQDKQWFPWADKLMSWFFTWISNRDGVPSLKSTKESHRNLQELYGIQTFKYKGSFGHIYYVNSLADILAQEMCNPKVRPKLHFYPEDRGNRPFSEARQGEKWLNEIPDEQLTPMIRLRRGGENQDYYIFEPAMLRDGTIWMPHRWIRKDNKFVGRCWGMQEVTAADGTSSWRVNKNEHRLASEDELVRSFPELKGEAGRGFNFNTEVAIITEYYEPWSGTIEKWTLTDPAVGNQWRVRAKGRLCLAFPIWLYCDDTSGNTSKKWNEHNSYLFTAVGLDRSEISKEYNVHFLCTSNCAPPLEMLDGIVDQLCDAQEHGIWSWDSEYDEPALLVPFTLSLLGDNPMQSEFACHIGLRGKFFCRVCQVKGKDSADGREEVRGDSDEDSDDDDPDDGNDAASATSAGSKTGRKRKRYVETPEAMAFRVRNFVTPGLPREKERTIKVLEQHLQEAKTVGSETRCRAQRTASGIKDTYQMYFVDRLVNSYKHRRGVPSRQSALDNAIETLPERTTSSVWRMRGLNPHSDTPVEVLHVVLLGFVKYLWRDVIKNQVKDKVDKKATLSACLSSVWVEGLGLDSLLAGNTLVNYYGSLTGGDFRKLAQVAPFVLHGLVSEESYNTWVALSKLIPLIWQPEIGDLESYLATLTQEIQNFLVLAAKWSIRWFNKPKFHILVHLPDHIRRYGPAILFATETFESFNVVIREKSIHSNRHAPSHDLAVAFAAGSRVRHFCSGGKFLQVSEIPELCTEEEQEAASNFDDFTLPQSQRVTRVQRYFRKHKPKAVHWRTIGAGLLAVVKHSMDTVGRYLGLAPSMRDKMKARKDTCTFEKGIETTHFAQTETGRLFPELNLFSSRDRASKRFRVAKEVFLYSGDRCSLSSGPILRRDKEKFSTASPFVIVRVTDSTPVLNPPDAMALTPAGQTSLHVAHVKEILQYLGDRPAILAVNPDCILAQVYAMGREPSRSGMLHLLAANRYVVLDTKNVLCTVNVQHDCIRNDCQVKEVHFRRQERHITPIRKGAVVHEGDLHDIVLNTAQMRDALYVQRFRIPMTLLDVEQTLMESVKKEVESRRPKNSRLNPLALCVPHRHIANRS